MKVLNASKIYSIWNKITQEDKSFKDWINEEKAEHAKRHADKANDEKHFLIWLNKRYFMKVKNLQAKADGMEENADAGQILGKVADIAGIIKGNKPQTNTNDALLAQQQESLNASKRKTILGLEPIVFYSITSVVVLGTAFGIYKLIKHLSKK